jgi:hypothetical protein
MARARRNLAVSQSVSQDTEDDRRRMGGKEILHVSLYKFILKPKTVLFICFGEFMRDLIFALFNHFHFKLNLNIHNIF